VCIHTHTHTCFRITRVNIILITSITICRTVIYHKAFSDGKINIGNSRVKMMHIKVKVKQSPYRPGVVQRVPGS